MASLHYHLAASAPEGCDFVLWSLIGFIDVFFHSSEKRQFGVRQHDEFLHLSTQQQHNERHLANTFEQSKSAVMWASLIELRFY